jgi:hypothetical protein
MLLWPLASNRPITWNEANPASQRIERTEQFSAYGVPHDADSGAGAQLTVAERPAGLKGPVAHTQILIVGPGDGGGPVLVADNACDGLGRGRGYGGQRPDIPGNRLDIFGSEGRGRRHQARPQMFPRRNHQQIAAETGDLPGYLDSGAAAEGHHENDGRNADDDAQNGQKRSQDIAPDLPQGQ